MPRDFFRNRSTARPCRSACRGVTLIELIVVMVLAAVVFTIGAGIVVDTARSFDTARDMTDIGWQGRVALERMEREVRAVNGTAGITTWTASSLTFTTTGGSSITYALSGSTLQRTEDANPAQPLADNVTSLAFSYWNRAGAAVVPGVGSVNSIYYVTVALGVAKGDFSGAYRTTVHPESF